MGLHSGPFAGAARECRANGGGPSCLCEWRVVGAAFRCPWSDLPERCGQYKTVHKRFSRGAAGGVWECVFRTLTKEANKEYLRIDSTIVRAHQPAATARK